MKLLALLFAAAGLSGCVAYPYNASAPYYGPGYAPGYYSQGVPYVVEPAASVYFYGGRDRYERGWDRRDGRRRDSDRDGVPDRYDRRPLDPQRR